MSEKAKGVIGKAIEKALVVRRLVKAVKEGASTPKEIVGEVLDQARAVPLYEKENDERFLPWRKKLNTEPGIFIANHPGRGDVFFFMDMIERKDVLFLVSAEARALSKDLMKEIGADHFLEVTKDPSKLRAQFKTISNHIRKGGLFVLFPSGGHTGKEMPDFQSAFKFLVERVLSPTDMIYTAQISAGDLDQAHDERKRHLPARVGERLLETSGIEVISATPDDVVAIDEHYTQANEWIAVLQSSAGKDKNKILTDYYKNLFKK